MIVCHCVGVTDHTLKRVIQEEGVCTLAGVVQRTGAGRCCAPCRDEISSLLYSLTPAAHNPVADTPAVAAPCPA